MKRRKFIYTTSTVIAASSLYAFSNEPDTLKSDRKRPLPDQFEQPVLKGIAYGLNAPNPHNTQAWKFQNLSPNEMLFFVDEKRLLTATDPTTRQIHIGCGCFLECCRLGMQIAGFDTTIKYFPSEEKYQKQYVGQLPIASIKFTKNTAIKVDFLAKLLFTRSTSRLAYKNMPVALADYQQIQGLVQAKHAEILLTHKPKKLAQILPTLAKGMEVETFTYRTHDESRKWFRKNDTRIEQERDGINLLGGGIKGLKKWVAEKQLKGLEEEKWHAKKLNEYSLKGHSKKVLSSKGIITLKTAQNGFVDWVYAGEDYLRLQLACQQFGYYLHPLSQVLQEFKEMKAVRLEFEEKMEVKRGEKIQMALRVGKSKKPYKSYL